MLKTLKWRVLVRAFRDSFFHCDVQGAVGAVRDGLADAVDLRLGCCKKTTMVNGSKNWWKEISFFAGCSFLGKKIWHERLCLYLFVYIYICVIYIHYIYRVFHESDPRKCLRIQGDILRMGLMYLRWNFPGDVTSVEESESTNHEPAAGAILRKLAMAGWCML